MQVSQCSDWPCLSKGRTKVKLETFISLAITIGFSQTNLSISEADGTLSLMIIKEGDSEIDVEIEILLEDVSAIGMFNYLDVRQ